MRVALVVLLLAASALARAELLRVGPERELKRPSEAARIARDGDVVEIDAGTYEGDAAVWSQNDLMIRAVGGRAHLHANGAHAEGKAIWVLKGARITVEGFEFSGAAVPHRNGTGIRAEGTGLVVRNCYFHHNEGGMLVAHNADSDVLIEHSEFAHNSVAGRHSHNLYVNWIRSLTLRFSHVHHAVVGHNVKSRALRNEILYNRITDEADGRSSYAIDLPDGGVSYVIGNLIQQGPRTENDALVAYGAESMRYASNELYLVNNTLVNDAGLPARFVFARYGRLWAVNNVFLGPGILLAGGADGELRNNLIAARSDFVAPDRFDYRPADGSAAIATGVEPGDAHGFPLRPTHEYVHPLGGRAREARRPLDIGALEFRPQP